MDKKINKESKGDNKNESQQETAFRNLSLFIINLSIPSSGAPP